MVLVLGDIPSGGAIATRLPASDLCLFHRNRRQYVLKSIWRGPDFALIEGEPERIFPMNQKFESPKTFASFFLDGLAVGLAASALWSVLSGMAYPLSADAPEQLKARIVMTSNSR